MWMCLLRQFWMLFLQFYMCCSSFSCAFELQLVPVLALGLVRALEHEQHLLLHLLFFLFLLLFLLKGCCCFCSRPPNAISCGSACPASSGKGGRWETNSNCITIVSRWRLNHSRKNELMFSYPIVKGCHAIHARPRALKPHKLQNSILWHTVVNTDVCMDLFVIVSKQCSIAEPSGWPWREWER